MINLNIKHRVLEVQVQRQWSYLENIFGGSEDIRKQLPGETLLFNQVNESFVSSMNRLKVSLIG